jgi:hypothetical protein
MAVRFDADGKDYNTTSVGVTTAPFTIMCWWKISVDRNAFSTAFSMDNGSTTGNSVAVQTQADGVTVQVYTYPGALGPNATAQVVGDWYRIAVTLSGTSLVFYHGASTGALTLYPQTVGTPVGMTTLRIGETVGEWLNGCVANFKVYAAALTQAEVEREFSYYQPSRTDQLVHWYPFLRTETTDYSGGARTLSGGTGSTTEDGPPVSWGPAPGGAIRQTSIPPTVDVGRNTYGTVGFPVTIQAVETGPGITSRAWTVVSGPAEVATTIGTTSLLSWSPTAAGVYELEYDIVNAAGAAYDTVYVTANAGGTVVDTQSVVSTTTSLVCNKPTGLAQYDVMLAVQSGDFAAHDEMKPPAGWQPLFEYDVGQDNLHVKGWTLTTGASEPSTYTFTQGASSAGVVSITAMRGVVEAGARWDLSYVATTSATRTCPTVEIAAPGSILLCGAVADPGAARTWTPPTGMTELVDVQSTTNTTHTVASKLDPGQPTGTKDFTASGLLAAAGGIQWSVAFQMPYDPLRGVENKSMISFVRTT